MPQFKPSPYRDEIIKRLKEGIPPAELGKIYPRRTVYYLNEKLLSGELDGKAKMPSANSGASGSNQAFAPPDVITTTPGKTATKQAAGVTGVDLVELPGEKTLPLDALSAVRGILGIVARPKVLTMPTPELLYPAMVISIKEWGWTPMRPDDFIDTVLDKFLRSADVEYNTYIKRSGLEKLVAFAKKHGYDFKDLTPESGNGNNGNGNKEGQNDSTESTGPTNKESGSGGEPGAKINDGVGANTGTEGANCGPPI